MEQNRVQKYTPTLMDNLFLFSTKMPRQSAVEKTVLSTNSANIIEYEYAN